MTKKVIPTKNYIILFGLIVLVICACFAFYNLYNIYQDNKISISPLATKEVLYEDLKNATKEIGADTFLVISYVQNREVHEKEIEIKKYLNKNNLLDNVMYLNITEYMSNQDFTEDLNNTLKLKGPLKISKFPALVYYKDGIPTHTIDSKDHLLNQGDFAQMIEMYDLAS